MVIDFSSCYVSEMKTLRRRVSILLVPFSIMAVAFVDWGHARPEAFAIIAGVSVIIGIVLGSLVLHYRNKRSDS